MDVERLNAQHFGVLFDFEQENKAWFEQFVPARPSSYSNFVSFCHAQQALLEEQEQETSLFFVVVDSDKIIARINATQLTTGESAHGECASKECELGYRVGEDYQQQGVASFAVARVLQLLHNDYGVRLVFAKAATNNPASTRVLEKSGFNRVSARTEPVRIKGETLHLAQFECLLTS
ncbi:GNAT family N-acetyltransferase [Vibrio sp. 10N]|uniref:GNAT family N-acetyltransferase n=1 Tax=Vibrio sp. 10N TaxID=3058938 RepID=UPI00281315E5|nr:GNAT family N-acetyltransferase [Vibrio sp. 10N]